MILIDSNILMYAAGAAHAHREASATLLEWVAAERIDAAIDTEVFAGDSASISSDSPVGQGPSALTTWHDRYFAW